ncbi:MAG: HIT family protein [Desulfomicrobium sp.]|nr:HIT family protein [Desulfomicrobium sp.]
MESFLMHPTLAADCHVLGTWRDLRLLLHRDAHVRWFILVPETGATEWHELSAPLREQLLTASSMLGAMLKRDEGCDKVNIAAIGNMVPQFHFHVIGRWKTDPYWPGVVWGRSVPGRSYAAGDVENTRARVMGVLEGSQTSVNPGTKER